MEECCQRERFLPDKLFRDSQNLSGPRPVPSIRSEPLKMALQVTSDDHTCTHCDHFGLRLVIFYSVSNSNSVA